jgi:1,4-dihydroxy-2-naphthoyl-CoA hydrolase
MDAQKALSGFDSLLGVEFMEVSGDRLTLQAKIRPDLHQPYGIVHGGVYCALVETAASIAGAMWLGEDGDVVGVANSTDFLRAIREGTLTATATPIHRGRTQQLWQVHVTDDGDRLIARGQVRLANLRSADGIGQPPSGG